MGSHSRDALHAWFLGPRAENAEMLERLVTEALRDHCFWRRNYHPEDGFTIRETEKRREGYEDAVATLTQELMGLLAELKRDVPFFSGGTRATWCSSRPSPHRSGTSRRCCTTPITSRRDLPGDDPARDRGGGATWRR